MGLEGGSPVLFHRVLDGTEPHPTVRITCETAKAMGNSGPTFASPEFVDRPAASCPGSSEPADCRRTAMLCREKLCRVLPEFP